MVLPSNSLIILLAMLQLDYQTVDSCYQNASCGCSHRSLRYPKIVGGQNARIETWSWVVSIRVRNQFRCAGSIISNLWVLTAAHCFSTGNHLEIDSLRINPSDIAVHIGSKNPNNETLPSFVVDVVVHPDFDESYFVNDIALLKLSSPLRITDRTLAKVCLPTATSDEYPPVNSSLVAVGWGRLWEKGPESPVLQQVILKAVSSKDPTCYRLVYDELNQFCAGVENSEKDTCQGDSGGPLMMFTSSQQWVIVGITSFGYGCAQVGYSGIYTRIATYLDWIHTSINHTDDAMYAHSSTSDSPFNDHDVDWQTNRSFKRAISAISLAIVLVLLLFAKAHSSE